MIQPPATIGILGGGQLGRMTAIAGRQMGFRFVTFEPGPGCPAAEVSDHCFTAPYDDFESLGKFCAGIDACTLEFENIPSATAEFVEERVPLRPGAHMLATCQNRLREKLFLRNNCLPCVKFEIIESLDALKTALAKIGCPAVLKTADFGYDGKGQIRIKSPEEAESAWNGLDVKKAVLEEWVEHSGEFSVIVARNQSGEKKAFPPAENIHIDHILHLSKFPADLSEDEEKTLLEAAYALVDAFEMVGMAAIEFFRCKTGWIINEVAPRPHNSGHFTIEGCVTSQFEQCVRATAGLPFGDTSLAKEGAMLNILGDLWQIGEPDWAEFLKYPDLKLHLYGKAEAKVGRKMGHLTLLGDDLHDVMKTVEELENRFRFRV